MQTDDKARLDQNEREMLIQRGQMEKRKREN